MNKEELYQLSNRLMKRAKLNPVVGFDKRDIYKLVQDSANTIIIGPRRIGKTTLLEAVLRVYSEKHMVNIKSLKFAGVEAKTYSIGDSDPQPISGISIEAEAKNVLYLKLDSLEFSSMNEKELKAVQLLIRNTVLDDGVDFLLLDEIQTLPNWTMMIKDIKDLATKDIRIIGTGSNSNELIKGSEHGTGRFEVKFFGVLSLLEYKEINNIKNLKENDYINYMQYGHFPQYTFDSYSDDVSSSIIEKAFSSTEKNKTNIFKILKWITKNPGQEIKTSTIGGDLEISRQYIEDYFSVLQDGQLIFKLPNALGKSIKRKVYSLIPGSFTLFDGKLLSETSKEEQGAHFENFVFIQLLSLTHTLSDRMLWGYLSDKKAKGKNEIDFVRGTTGFEVKLTLRQDHKQYIPFARSKGIKTLYFVYKNGDTLEDYIEDGIAIKYIRWESLSDREVINEIKMAINQK